MRTKAMFGSQVQRVMRVLLCICKTAGNLVIKDPSTCEVIWSTQTKRSHYYTDEVNSNEVEYDLEYFFGPAPAPDHAVFAQMQTFLGSDTSQVRVKEVTATSFAAFVEEEQSFEAEANHVNMKEMAFLTMSPGPINDVDGNGIGEVLSVSKSQTNRQQWHTISFHGTYQNAVVIGMINSHNDSPVTVRIRSVCSTSMEFQLQEWLYLERAHIAETIVFLVLEAELLEKFANVEDTWKLVDGLDLFESVPGVLSQTMSYNGWDPVVTRHDAVTMGTFKVRLQEDENRAAQGVGNHIAEVVGIAAFGPIRAVEQCENNSPLVDTTWSVESMVQTQLATLENHFLSVVPAKLANDPAVDMTFNIGTELLSALLSQSNFNILLPQTVCAGAVPPDDIVSLAAPEESGVSSCAELHITSNVDVLAFGFELSDGKGLCGAVDLNTMTFAVAFTELITVEAKKISTEFELNAIALSLSGSLKQETLNDIYEWDGVPSKRTFFGHFYIKATAHTGKDFGEEACEKAGIPDDDCAWKDLLAIGVDSAATALVNVDPDRNGCSGVSPFDPTATPAFPDVCLGLYLSLQVVPTLTVLTFDVDLSHLVAGNIDLYLYEGGAGSELIFSAQLVTPSLADVAGHSNNAFGALSKMFDGPTSGSAFTATADAYSIFTATRRFTGLRIRNMQSQLNFGAILNAISVAGVDIDLNLKNELDKMMPFTTTTGYTIEYTADMDDPTNPIERACISVDGGQEICTKFCSDHSDCPTDSYCLLGGTLGTLLPNTLPSICLPKMDNDYPCIEDAMCDSGHCIGLLSLTSFGTCEECRDDSNCGGNEYCDNVLPLGPAGSDHKCHIKKTNGGSSDCFDNSWCQSNVCVGVIIGSATAGFCEECNSNSHCATNEYCDNVLPAASDYECHPKKAPPGNCWGDSWCTSNDCTGIDFGSNTMGICSDCDTLDSVSECPSGKFCWSGLYCKDQWSDGTTGCLSDNACQHYCNGVGVDGAEVGYCSRCTPTTVNRNGHCPSGQHCTASFSCTNDKGAGWPCTHSDECINNCQIILGVGYCT